MQTLPGDFIYKGSRIQVITPASPLLVLWLVMVSAAFLCVVVGFITRLSSSSTQGKQDPSFSLWSLHYNLNLAWACCGEGRALSSSLLDGGQLAYVWYMVLGKSLYRAGLQVVLKFILLLKFLGQLCMLTKFTNKLVYPTKRQKPKLNVQKKTILPPGSLYSKVWALACLDFA